MSSPVQSIPPELVIEIFKWCFDAYPLSSPKATPVVLSRVCKTWHAIATSSSELWTNFSIEISMDTPLPSFHFVQCCLRRSRFQLLNVCIKLNGSGYFDEPNSPEWHAFMQMVHPILSAIMDTSTRWKSAVLSLPGTEQSLKLFENRTTPALQSLHLNLEGWDSDGVHHLGSLLESATSLRDLYWNDVVCWNYLTAPPFARAMKDMVHSWGNITHMRLRTWVTLNDAYHLLSRCPQLVGLELDRFAEKTNDPVKLTTNTPLVFPDLTHLTIRHRAKDNSVGVFLRLLVCPKLHSVEISNCTGYPDVEWPQAEFTSLLARSSCHLRSLYLEYLDITEEELIACLEQCSNSLQVLEVRGKWGGNCVSDTLLSQLTLDLDWGEYLSHKSPNAVLCPNLEYLVLSKVVACSNGALARMLRSRRQQCEGRKPCVPLSHVDIRFPFSGRRNLQDVCYLDQLRESELAVRPSFLT